MPRLTQRTLDALPAPTKARGEKHYDTELRGFGVVLYPTGNGSWFIEYRDPRRSSTTRCRKMIGRVGELTPAKARELAKDHLAVIRAGGDPWRAQGGLLFRDWVETYLEHIEEAKKRPDLDRHQLKRAVRHFGQLTLEELRPDDLGKAMRAVAKNARKDKRSTDGHTAANRWLASVSACLSAAVRAGHLETNPAQWVDRFREAEPRQRVLSKDELQRLLEAIGGLAEADVRAALLLLVQTGLRRSEALSLRWEDVDLDEGVLHLRSTKAGKPQAIPIAPATVDLLAGLPRASGWVFPGRFGKGHRTTLRSAWRRVRAAAGVEDVTIHDLRRTFGLAVAKKHGLTIASKLLRHSDVRITAAAYAPFGVEDLREAMEGRVEELGD